MIRLKFVLLALVALGLWAAQAYLLAPVVSARAVDAAQTHADRALLRLEQRAMAHQDAFAEAALRLLSKPDLVDAIGLKRAAPTPEQLGVARTQALAALPELQRGGALVGLWNEAGQLWSVDDGAPRSGLDGVEISTLLRSGTWVLGQVAGAPFRFAAIPLGGSEAGKGPTLVVGVPLPFARWAEQGVGEDAVPAVGVAVGGRLLAGVGPLQPALERARTQLAQPSASPVIDRGANQALGPLSLPVFSGDSAGAPRWVGARRVMEQGGFELLAVSSAEPFIQPLADFQRFSLFAALGFLGLALLAILTSEGAPEPAVAMSVPGAVRNAARPTTPAPPAPPPAASAPSAGTLSRAAVGPLPVAVSNQPPEEASPDDFHFGHTRVGVMPTVPPPNPFDDGRPPPPVDPHAVPTASYPAHAPKADPFALAGDELGASLGHPEDSPEATRVAAIPHELLRQSAQRSGSFPIPAGVTDEPAEAESWSVRSSGSGDEDERQHFQEVFQAFLATREQCGESGEAMTYERFLQKLRKNKEQLVQKYGCRTVRFQVYVKDGKAALKATPVRD